MAADGSFPDFGTGQQSRTPNPILRGADFVAGHKPPVWLIDGIIQRGRLYACTSLTGHGKTAVWLFNACMVQSGRSIGTLDVFQGNTLFLAGENPADLEARMLGMAAAFKIPAAKLPYVLPGSFPIDQAGIERLKTEIAAIGVDFALIIVDTASSFFPGDDENSNVQAGTYGRTLRQLTDCPGNPAIVILSHPVKNASKSNLVPRGGGAFLNELDGNTTLWSETRGEVTELYWQGKIRGPDFDPLPYRLKSSPTGHTDKKNRDILTIVAHPIDDFEARDRANQAIANEDAVLKALADNPKASLAELAQILGWHDDDGKPERWRVQRALQSLTTDKLVRKYRRKFTPTEAGKKALLGQED